MRKYIAIIIASLALFTGQAHAQRCLPKMQGIEVRADMADGFNLGGKDGGYSFGAALSTYTKKVIWCLLMMWRRLSSRVAICVSLVVMYSL